MEHTRPLRDKPCVPEPTEILQTNQFHAISQVCLTLPKEAMLSLATFLLLTTWGIPEWPQETGKIDHAMLSARHLYKLGSQIDQFATKESENNSFTLGAVSCHP